MHDILRRNTNDNLGVRYEIIPLLLSQNREQEAVAILDQYPEKTGNGVYLKAQIACRRARPNSRTAQKAMPASCSQSLRGAHRTYRKFGDQVDNHR